MLLVFKILIVIDFVMFVKLNIVLIFFSIFLLIVIVYFVFGMI